MAATLGDTMVSLDPTKWEEPKETFIGRLTECKYSDTDQSKTKEGQTFTEFLNLPRPKRQWRVVVERLDAVYKNKETGELSPMRRYMTIDLERYNEKDRTWSPMPKGNNKAFFTLAKWGDKKVVLHPAPEKNEGMVCEFEFLRTKMFGGSNAAKDIMYPLKILALPGQEFEFRGDVLEVEFDPARGDGSSGPSLDDAAGAVEAGGTTSGTAAGKSTTLSEDEVRQLLAADDIDGSDEDKVQAFVKAHKGELTAAIKTALITGDFFTEKS